MRFLRSWQELEFHHRVKIKSGGHNGFVGDKVHDFWFYFEFLEEALCDLTEYKDQRLFFGLRNVNCIEESHESRRKLSTAVCATNDHLDSFNLLENMSLSVPNALITEDQTQHLNRRLSSILFNSWHVDVINEVNELFSRRRDECNGSLFSEILEFALELQLSHCWRGLRSESEGKVGLSASFDDLVDDAGLSCSCWRSDINRVELINEFLYD